MRKDSSTWVRENVTDYIVSLIKDGKIRPGERLPSEHELMRRLNVGRSSVREAIRGLAMMGVVEAKRRRGTILVSPISNNFGDQIDRSVTYWAVRDLFDVRALLEGRAAAIAAERATEEDLKRIEKSAFDVQRKIELEKDYFYDNTKFHLNIAKASHNPILLHCLRSLIGSLRDVRIHFNEGLAHMPERDVNEHRMIVEAIKAGDARRARKAMEAHMRSYTKQVEESSRRPRPARS